MRRSALVLATACLCAPLLAAPAQAQAQAQAAQVEAPAPSQPRSDYDPWEGTNRNLFGIHESIDRTVLDPTARGYRTVTPSPVRAGVGNFLRNLRGPQIFANDVLQGELGRAGTTAARFGVNTTIGLLGILDPASDMGLERHTEDFGQTLGVWGVPSGPYLFLPLLGPSNVRDSFGAVVNMALDPFNWLEFEHDTEFMIVRGGLSAIAARESVLDAVDNVRESSIDPYVTFRSTYGILRESAIQNGRQNVQDLPDFDEMPNEDVSDFTPEASAPAALESVTPDTHVGSDAVQDESALLTADTGH